MTPHQFQALLAGIYVAVGLSAICVWGVLIYGWRRNGSLLPFAARPPAPWGPVGLVVAGLFAWSALNGVWNVVEEGAPNDITSGEIFGFAAACLAAAFASQLWVWLVNDGSLRDLGWPCSCAEWASDVGLGIVGAIALIAPVHAILATLVYGLDLQSTHHLIEAIQKNSDIVTTLAICFAAVIAAPIFEEILFRQLAQGWLERKEDELLNWRRRPLKIETADEAQDVSTTLEIANEFLETRANQPAPPKRSFAHLPYGWLPILISSTLFSLSHAGQGVAPVALFFLAIGLGFIYQRTHRIVPCIVLHMLFNAYSMILVGLSLFVEK